VVAPSTSSFLLSSVIGTARLSLWRRPREREIVYRASLFSPLWRAS
jgi:hypothetical protein